MALTEEEKAKIIEEEMLRRKIRESEEGEIDKFLRGNGGWFDETIRWGFIILVVYIFAYPIIEAQG